MRSPKVFFAALALAAALTAPAVAHAQETFNFPQEHDTVFGDGFFFGNFNWYKQGQGVHGRRIAANIEQLDAFAFTLMFGPSCIVDGTNMTLDVYINDRFVGNVPLPGMIPCATPPPIQGSFDLSSNPIPGQGTGKEFDIRFQLTGTSMAPCCGISFVSYFIDTVNSTVALAGHLNSGGGDGGGGDDGGGSGGGGGGGTVDNSEVLNRIGQAESNLSGAISGEGTTTRSAIQQVRDALGIVEGNVNAGIASAVLHVNAETALGIEKLATQLGISTSDLSFAIKGNGDAIGKVQKSIEDKLMPEVLKANQGIGITQEKVKELGDSFFERSMGEILSAGTGVLSMWTGGAILPVANFVQKSIMSVVNGALRPDRIVNKAMAEFNRGLKRIKKLFSFNAAFDLPWGDRAALDAITFGVAAETVDIPEFAVDPKYDQMLGPDKEEDNAFGAYQWFERAYQTLVRPEHDNGHHYAYGHSKDDGHETVADTRPKVK